MFVASMRLGQLVRGGLLIAFVIISSPALSQTVEIDPGVAIGPEIVRAGWDIKAWPSRINTIGEAIGLYQHVDANFLRAPFFPQAHAQDGTVDESQYDVELEAIRSIMAARPDVEIYASVKLSGANTFPSWVSQPTAAWPLETGAIFGNTVERPNPDHYSTMIVDFLLYLRAEGIKIDFLGLNNETNGAVPPDRYIATHDLLESRLDQVGFNGEYRDFQYVGPDTFGIPSAEGFINDLRIAGRLDTVDFVSSHYYPQNISGNETDWLDLTNLSSGKPLWHTELHMPSNSGAIAELPQTVRDAISVQFASFRNGVDSYIWWDSGDSLNQVRDVIKREVMTTTLGATPVFTTPVYQGKGDPDGLPLFQAFVEDSRVTMWIVNPGGTIDNLQVDLRSEQVALGLQGEYYLALAGDNQLLAEDVAPLTFNVAANGTSFTIDHIPAQSAAVVSFQMSEPEFSPGIAWGDATAIGTEADDVVTTGTLHLAVNGSVNNAPNIFLSGVEFVSGDVGSGPNIVDDGFSGSNPADLNPSAIGDTVAYQTFLGDVDFSTGSDGNPSTIVITNLIEGRNYLIQFWYLDNRGNQDSRNTTLSSVRGGDSVTLNDQFTIGNFTASTETESFTVSTSGNDGTGLSTAHITGFQVRLLPEVTDVLKGDIDLSGSINFFDIAPFIVVLSSGGFQAEADTNCDGEVTFFDIQPFIDLLAGS